ncbi:hypothetical protein BGW80DRAFT_1356062 [Lactifluus volemus]|nr:hypothetical protein BGW80DRAFT_1356062 [Lactifluus volemus]
MEDLFTARFARGDRKHALVHLRAVPSHKTHHSSTFRAGLALGLGFSALIDGILRCSQQQTRSAIPSWETLLYIYGIFQVPTLFAVLVGTNIFIWKATRINYVFIFELDTRTLLDHRKYLEVRY